MAKRCVKEKKGCSESSESSGPGPSRTASQQRKSSEHYQEKSTGCIGARGSGITATIDVAAILLIDGYTFAVKSPLTLVALNVDAAAIGAPCVTSGIAIPDDVSAGAIADAFVRMALVFGPTFTATSLAAVVAALLPIAVGNAGHADALGATGVLRTANAATTAAAIVAALFA